jgi:dethiobiotin synthetase
MGLLFITGTDTGVGKTTLTALLLCHLRQRGRRVVALKPFCSGGRDDAELLWTLQEGAVGLDEINPFHFKEPLAPLVAARMHGRSIAISEVLNYIGRAGSPTKDLQEAANAQTRRPRSQRMDESLVLIVEGAGGLLAPLGRGFDALDLIKRLRLQGPPPHRVPHASGVLRVIVVARNGLGTINHILLTVQALRGAGLANSAIQVMLMNTRPRDYSSASNPRLLRELLAPGQLLSLPFLGPGLSAAAFPALARRHRRVLGALLKDA